MINTQIGIILSVLAGLMMLYSFLPYARDILHGKVRPSRSARLMFVILLIVSLLQQRSLGSGWLLAMTLGDSIGAIAILMLAVKKGIGGLRRIDVACYILLMADITVWVSSKNALLALHLGVLADLIAMTPVFIKTWKQPWTETRLFFALGIVAPILNIIGAGRYSYAVLLLPLYIAFTNTLEVVLISIRQKTVAPPPGHPQVDHQPLT